MSTVKNFHNKISNYAQQSDYPYKVFAFFNIISHPIFYLIWRYIDTQGYENFYIRSGVMLLCIPLAFHDRWPQAIKSFLAWYWYITIIYSLLFFFTFMLLKNEISYTWSLNFLSGIVLWILLLDYKALSYLTPIGIILGFLTFWISTPFIKLPLDHIKVIIIISSSILIFGYTFSHRNHRLIEQKLIDLNVQSAAIAHEMRTPLGNINMIGHALKSMVTRHTDKSADSQKQLLLKHNEVDSLDHLADNLRDTVKAAQTFIDLMLANLKQDVSDLPCTHLSMAQCIEKIITVYPLTEQERQIIHMNIEHDFIVFGNEDFLQHVVFNLLKNSLYFIHAGNKGEIFITTQISETQNSLIFKDTGPGIESKKLANIFKPFHSTRPHGTGIGLAFCKKVIESFGGKIKVTSQCGEHTTFTISFTKSKEVC